MSWSERLAGARDVATHLPLSVGLLACDICWFELDPIPRMLYVQIIYPDL